MPQNCTKIVDHKLVLVEENKRRAVFRNPRQAKYTVSRVDGCLVSDNKPRCDYLVSEVGKASVLIELKGADVDHACDQLLATVNRNNVKPLLERKLGLLIICNRFPREDTKVQRARQKCFKAYKAPLRVVCGGGEFDIEKVATFDGSK